MDTTGNALPSVIVTTKIEHKEFFAFSDRTGFFTLNICGISDTSLTKPANIYFSLMGYDKKTIAIGTKLTNIKLPVIVLSVNNIQLSEVLVRSKPIVRNGDTTTFTVSAFKNKLDDNLEDVLKKMPGFDVDQAGSILFNGKPIQNILIEDDALTKNYKQISKNIGADMIDKVEMIDKYNSNPALKNLVNNGNQVMNLKLKNPKKLKAFGNIKAGVGVKDKLNASGNLFVINNKIKTMAIGIKNNVGESPYDAVTSSSEYNQTSDYEFDPSIIPNYIMEDLLFNKPLFSSVQNSLFNKSNMFVFNNSVTINKHLNVKYFSDVYIDKINQSKNTEVKNLSDLSLSYTENSLKTFKPLYLNNHLQLTYENEKSQLIVAGAYNYKNYKEDAIINAPVNYNNNINNFFKRLSGGLYFTHRIDSNRAYQFLLQNNYDTKSEQLLITQDVFRNFDTIYNTNRQLQSVDNNINYNKATLKYLFKKSGKNMSNVTISNTNVHSSLNSLLEINTQLSGVLQPYGYANKADIRNNNLLFSVGKSYTFKSLNIALSAGASYFTQTSTNLYPTNLSKIGVLKFSPDFNISYNIKSLHYFSLNIAYNNELPNLSMQAGHPILSAYRNLISTENIEGRINILKSSFVYSYRNFDKASNFLFSWFHSTQYKSSVNNINFARDFDNFSNSFINRNRAIDNFYFKYDKYLFKIKTGVTIKNSLLLFSNPSISNGQFASKKYLNYSSFLSFRPSIGKNINSNIGVEFIYNKDLNADVGAYSFNPFISFSSTLFKKLSIGTKLNSYTTNYFERKQHYFFGNVFLWQNIIKDRLDFKLSCINITNTSAVYSGYKNIFIERSIMSKTLKRYALFEINYKFR